MRFVTAAAALALISTASVVEAREAYATPTMGTAGSNPANSDPKDWVTTLIQEHEGYPNPNGRGRCTLGSRQITDARGAFIGYHTFNVCS